MVRLTVGMMVLAGAIGLIPAPAQAQAPGPAWALHVAGADRVAPGSTFEYRLSPRNIGDAPTDGTRALDVSLPEGITAVAVRSGRFPILLTWACSPPAGASTVHCDATAPIPVAPGQQAVEALVLEVAVDPGASGILSPSFTLSGGGAPDSASVTQAVNVSPVSELKIKVVDGEVLDAAGAAYTQAAGHPASASVSFQLNRTMRDGFAHADGGDPRDTLVDLPAGLIGNPVAMPSCPTDLRIPNNKQAQEGEFDPNLFCPLNSIVGVAEVTLTLQNRAPRRYTAPVFNLKPPPGIPAQFGFSIAEQKVSLDAELRSDGDYGVNVRVRRASQLKAVLGSKVTLWGVPADHSHDSQRCMAYLNPNPLR